MEAVLCELCALYRTMYETAASCSSAEWRVTSKRPATMQLWRGWHSTTDNNHIHFFSVDKREKQRKKLDTDSPGGEPVFSSRGR